MSSVKHRSLLFCLILQFLLLECYGQWSPNCRMTYNGTNGNISSPNYPSSYYNNANCTYIIEAATPSNISLTFWDLNLETNTGCTFDWVEISCESHPVVLPMRYCGTASLLSPISLLPCSRAVIRFRSDGSITYSGFSILYTVTQNYARVTVPPYLSCTRDCTLAEYSYTSPYRYCVCQMARSRYTTPRSCPPGCYMDYDFYGYMTCNCGETTASSACSPGCYRSTNYRGEPYCYCPGGTSTSVSCPYGCHADRDYFGSQYCNCHVTSDAPLWCSNGCTSAVDAYGYRYCRCPTTTMTPCVLPCYYAWNHTYSFYGDRYCYCPPTTTQPPRTGCDQTYTASSGVISSPNYPRAFPRDRDCTQYISLPIGSSIKIKPISIDLYTNYWGYCAYDYVEIIGCDDRSTTFCDYSGISTSGLDIYCDSSSMVQIRFHPYYGYYYSSYQGFKLSYSVYVSSHPHASETKDMKLGIGIGAGVGGFVLLVLLVVIVVLVVKIVRGSARREQQRIDDLTILCRSMNGSNGADVGGSVSIGLSRNEPNGPLLDFSNPLAADPPPAENPPPYQRVSPEDQNQDLASFNGATTNDETLLLA